MNVQNGPNTNPGQDPNRPNPGNGMTSADYTEGPIPNQQVPSYGTYNSQMDLVPNMTISQWLLVKLMLWVPILNLVMLIIWAVGNPGNGKEALVNFSRASLIWKAIEIGISILFWILFFIWLSAVVAGSTAYYY